MDIKGMLRFAGKVFIAGLIISVAISLVGKVSPTIAGFLRNPLGSLGA